MPSPTVEVVHVGANHKPSAVGEAVTVREPGRPDASHDRGTGAFPAFQQHPLRRVVQQVVPAAQHRAGYPSGQHVAPAQFGSAAQGSAGFFFFFFFLASVEMRLNPSADPASADAPTRPKCLRVQRSNPVSSK